ncbi:MAG: acyl-CoA thioesterase II, partial [Actinomycetota bacterium]
TLIPHGTKGVIDGRIMMASLDHAMWFHRPFRADEWLLYVQDTPSAQAGRGMARGSIYTADGELVVSVVQEGLIRQIDPDA